MSDDAASHHLDRAAVLFELRRLDDAHAEVARALAVDPGSARAHLLSARLHHELRRHPDALAAAQASLALEETASGLQVAALALRSMGDLPASEEHLERAIAAAPEWPLAHVSLGLTLLARANESDGATRDELFGAATRAATRGRDLAPTDAITHYALAVIHRDQGLYVEAADHGAACLDVDPAWHEAHLVMAQIRTVQGMPRLASRHLSAAGATAGADRRPLERLKALNRRLTGRLDRRRGRAAPQLVPEAAAILAIDRELGRS